MLYYMSVGIMKAAVLVTAILCTATTAKPTLVRPIIICSINKINFYCAIFSKHFLLFLV